MTRFHLGKNGPAPCNANDRACPLGGEHFDTEEDAFDAYDFDNYDRDDTLMPALEAEASASGVEALAEQKATVEDAQRWLADDDAIRDGRSVEAVVPFLHPDGRPAMEIKWSAKNGDVWQHSTLARGDLAERLGPMAEADQEGLVAKLNETPAPTPAEDLSALKDMPVEWAEEFLDKDPSTMSAAEANHWWDARRKVVLEARSLVKQARTDPTVRNHAQFKTIEAMAKLSTDPSHHPGGRPRASVRSIQKEAVHAMRAMEATRHGFSTLGKTPKELPPEVIEAIKKNYLKLEGEPFTGSVGELMAWWQKNKHRV